MKEKQTNDQKHSNQQLTKRMLWILDNRVPHAKEKLFKKIGLDLQDLEILNVFLSADPSTNHSATQWLIESYLREGFRWEDVQAGANSKCFETLKLFAKFKNKLSVEQRSLFDYSNLSDVYKAIELYVLEEQQLGEQLTNRSLKRETKERATKESYQLLNQDNLKVIIPLTKESAQWWGKGTQWCTSSTISENYFNQYNRTAPLFIMLFEEVEKFEEADSYEVITSDFGQIVIDTKKPKSCLRKLQLWFDKDDIQWMDEGDAALSIDYVQKNWKSFEKFVLWAFEKNSDFVRWIPETSFTQTICLKIADQNIGFFHLIPEQFRTLEIYQKALKHRQIELSELPEKFISYQTCYQAVMDNCWHIEHVPQKLLTTDMILKAVQKDRLTLNSVKIPNKIWTKEFCKQLIDIHSDNFEFFPQKLRTAEFSQISVEKNPLMFEFVPESLKSFELSISALKHSTKLLQFVPKRFLSQELCEQLVQKDPIVLDLIPTKFVTFKMCEQAVILDGRAIGMVGKWINDNLCKKAISNIGEAIYSVPEKFLTKEIYWLAVQKDGLLLNFVPKELRTNQICWMAVEQNPQALSYVPSSIITPELCKKAIEKDINSFHRIPENLITQDLCDFVVQKNCKFFKNILSQFKTYDLCLKFIQENPYYIREIPNIMRRDEVAWFALKKYPSYISLLDHKNITQQMCEYVAENEVAALRFIPQNMQTHNIKQLNQNFIKKQQIEQENKINSGQSDNPEPKYWDSPIDEPIANNEQEIKPEWSLETLVKEWNEFNRNLPDVKEILNPLTLNSV